MASDLKATYRPSALMADKSLGSLPCSPALFTLTRVVMLDATLVTIERELLATLTSAGSPKAVAVRVQSPKGSPVVSQVKATVVEEPGARLTD